MRILQTMTGPPGTGSGTVALAVHAELLRQGHEAHLFYPDVPADPAKPADPGHHVWPFPVEGPGADGTIRLATFPKMIPDPHPREVGESLTAKSLSPEALDLYLRAAQEALAAVAGKLRPDVLECHHLWSVTWAAAELGLPYIAVPHGSDQMGYRYDPRFRPWADRAARDAAFVLPLSDHVRREVIELYPVDPGRVLVTPPGYDAEIFRPAPPQPERVLEGFGIADDGRPMPLVSFSGKISHTKGVDILLTANRIVQQRHPCRLVVAGTGSLEVAFEPEVRRRFHLENVHLVGHVDHPTLARLHNASAVSVAPSREEGFGVAALEAMGCGCPVVASRVGGLPEFIVGALVPPDDANALAEALLMVLERPAEEARELRRTVHARAREYSWPRLVERRLEIYAATLDRKDRGAR